MTQFLCLVQIISNMMYALSVGELFEGVEIIIAIIRQIFGNSGLLFKPKSARTSSCFDFFFCDFTLVIFITQLWLRTGQAFSESGSTSFPDSSDWSASEKYSNLAKIFRSYFFSTFSINFNNRWIFSLQKR